MYHAGLAREYGVRAAGFAVVAVAAAAIATILWLITIARWIW